jgi:cytochrome c oxidase cbb3-type subunit III
MPAKTKPFNALRLTGMVLSLVLFLLTIGVWAADAQVSTDGQVQLGASLFAQNCAVCHGLDGQGRVGAQLAKNWPSVRPDLTVKNIIANGVPGSKMPAWSQANGGPLDSAQIDALTAYILSWQTGGASNIIIVPTPTLLPPVTPLPNITGDTAHGAVLFQQNCVMCHGQSGQGKIGKTLAKNWSGDRPDLLIFNTIKNGVPDTKMPAWSLANGGPLSDQDMQDLTAYVLALPKVIEVQAPTEPTPPAPLSWLSGWGGVLVFLALLLIILVGVLYFQRKNKSP